MRIGIDISQIVYEGSGVARYTQGLVEAILADQSGHEWVLFFSSLRRELSPDIKRGIRLKNIKLVHLRIPPTLLSVFWNKWHVGKVEWLTGPLDWFITSDWTEPPVRAAKKATIVHDLVYLRYPETVNWKVLKTQQSRLIHVTRESNLVFADSNSTAKDIVELLTIPPAKIKVLYPGVKILPPTEKKITQTLNKFNLKEQKFILAVGKLEPRKNLERLIAAYGRLHHNQIPLVIVGPKGWGSLDLAGVNVKNIGFVSDSELAALYKTCLIFVYPSLYEGFGYPLVEAASLGAPLVVSNTSSLKELGEGISISFNPENVKEMTAKIELALSSPELRKALTKKAELKAEEFSWSKSLPELISHLEAY